MFSHVNLGNAFAPRPATEAIAEFQKAIALDPKDATAYIGLGNVLSDQHRNEEAIVQLREAVSLDPKLAIAHGNLGKVLRDQHQEDRSRD